MRVKLFVVANLVSFISPKVDLDKMLKNFFVLTLKMYIVYFFETSIFIIWYEQKFL